MYEKKRICSGISEIVFAGLFLLCFMSVIGNLYLSEIGIQIDNSILGFFAGVIAAIAGQVLVFVVGMTILLSFFAFINLIKKVFVAVTK